MTPSHAFGVLGLEVDADREQVRTSYRRLALENHPDRNQGSKESFVRFKRITRAYRVLETKFRIEAENQDYGPCDKCGRFERRHVALDNNRYCRACLISAGGRLALPSPMVIVVSCGFAVVSLVVAIVLLIMFAFNGRVEYGAATIIASGSAVVSLAITAVTIGHAARKRKRGRESFSLRGR